MNEWLIICNDETHHDIMHKYTRGVIMNYIFIYGLVDPNSWKIRYVGKSIRPKERLQNHMNEVSNCHRCNWLQSLKAKGQKPVLFILDKMVEGANWQESEKKWIAIGKRKGWPLTNNTSGGDGVEGLPFETRQRMAKAWLGRKHKPETLIKLSKASKGRKKTEDMKEHMSDLMKGREITWGDKISENLRKISEEQVKEIKMRLENGEKVKDLAEEFGVHRTTISKIKTGVYGLKYDGKKKRLK